MFLCVFICKARVQGQKPGITLCKHELVTLPPPSTLPSYGHRTRPTLCPAGLLFQPCSVNLTQLLTPPHHTGCLHSFAVALVFPLNLC